MLLLTNIITMKRILILLLILAPVFTIGQTYVAQQGNKSFKGLIEFVKRITVRDTMVIVKAIKYPDGSISTSGYKSTDTIRASNLIQLSLTDLMDYISDNIQVTGSSNGIYNSDSSYLSEQHNLICKIGDSTLTFVPTTRIKTVVADLNLIAPAGTFDDAALWTLESRWTIAAGKLSHDYSAGAAVLTTCPLSSNTNYSLTYTISNYTGTNGVRIRLSTTGTGTTRTENGTFTETQNTGDVPSLQFLDTGGGFTGSIDNVIVSLQ